ncbi:Protein CBG03066 [Caenorhabditis briggsae]|uniref:Protein CBG03066 n=1 Tax=Caenorhabditis briggsae TaxID=6238 RepID=A8WSV4_CAEBR|nr:Protein CBG03066 [Caenorhabditis briggsae]CAP23563.2 Protein CBG03066 [Caenorhabditis briggsae]
MTLCGWPTECTEISCCESYIFRLYLLIFTFHTIVLLLSCYPIIGATEEKRRNRLRRQDTEEQHRIDERSFEETKYLRRFSELK